MSCSPKLALPLKGGKVYLMDSESTFNIYPTNNYIITAAENCIIERILIVDDSYSVIVNGKFKIIYTNIYQCFIHKGDILKKGDAIGQLKSTMSDWNYLTVGIRELTGKNSKKITSCKKPFVIQHQQVYMPN